MLYNDYTRSKNVAHDYIRWPCVRVSSAEIPSVLNGAPFGVWYETWVFSDCPKINTTQVTFKVKTKCLKAHKHIVKNIRGILNEEGK